MIKYRIQGCGDEWILRHPDIIMPMLQHKNKEELIKLLPAYFKKKKGQALVQVLDRTGQFEREIEFNT